MVKALGVTFVQDMFIQKSSKEVELNGDSKNVLIEVDQKWSNICSKKDIFQ